MPPLPPNVDVRVLLQKGRGIRGCDRGSGPGPERSSGWQVRFRNRGAKPHARFRPLALRSGAEGTGVLHVALRVPGKPGEAPKERVGFPGGNRGEGRAEGPSALRVHDRVDGTSPVASRGRWACVPSAPRARSRRSAWAPGPAAAGRRSQL